MRLRLTQDAVSVWLLCLLCLLVCISLPTPVVAPDPFSVTFPCTTTASDAFDISNLNCDACSGTGQVPSDDGLECRCDWGYLYVGGGGGSFTCSGSCNASAQASFRDNSACVSCASSFDVSTQDCVCGTDEVLSEYDTAGNVLSSKACTKCPNGSRVLYSSSDPSSSYECRSCPDPNGRMEMDSAGVCTCSDAVTYTMTNSPHQCLDVSVVTTINSLFPVASSSIVYFWGIDGGYQVANSYYFAEHYLAAGVNCLNDKNKTACNLLGNLCALQKFYAGSTACQLFDYIETQVAGSSNGFSEWKPTLPLLQFSSSVNYLSANDINAAVSLFVADAESDRSTIATLRLVVAVYRLNGTLHSFQDLTTQINLCVGDHEYQSSYLRFGTTFKQSCTIDLAEVTKALLYTHEHGPVGASGTTVSTSAVTGKGAADAFGVPPQISTADLGYPQTTGGTMYFFDPYFVDTNNNLYPVPVKVMNYRTSSGATPNGGSFSSEKSSNILHHRFYLFDYISGQSTLNSVPETVSWLTHAELRVSMSGDSSSNINPPYLAVEYGERLYSAVLSSSGSDKASIKFNARYTKDIDGLWIAAIVLFSFALFFAVIFGTLNTVRRVKWNGRQAFTCPLCSEWLLLVFAQIAHWIFWLIFLLSSIVFIFYKGQSTVFILLPVSDSEEHQLLTDYLIVLFVAQSMYVIYRIFHIVNVDVFLVDWEKKRDIPPEDDPYLTMRTPGVFGPSQSASGVSVWRKIFIANEMYELLGFRSISVGCCVMLLLVTLKGLGLEGLATSQPDASNLDADAAPMDPILRFCISTFFWLLFIFVQHAYRSLIHRRYVSDPYLNFVDLLQICNVSLIVFDGEQHGWYIHGRSVHAHADTNLTQMIEQLRNEERNWIQSRGLFGDKDTFEVYFTKRFRNRYRAILNEAMRPGGTPQSEVVDGSNKVITDEKTHAGVPSGSSRRPQPVLSRHGAAAEKKDTQRLVEGNENLTSFFKEFFNRATPEYPFEYGEKSFLQKRLNLPPYFGPTTPCTFYDDFDLNFRSTMLAGVEYHWLLFLIIIYACVDLMQESTLAASFVTYVVDWGMTCVFSYLSRRNLAAKTLIDPRFLV